MQFLKILFWCLLAFVAALFTYGNWTSIPIRLWNGMEALVKLPFLLLVVFLIGFVPTWLYNRAIRWRLRQRLVVAERSLADARGALQTAPMPQSMAITAPASTAEAMAAEGRLL